MDNKNTSTKWLLCHLLVLALAQGALLFYRPRATESNGIRSSTSGLGALLAHEKLLNYRQFRRAHPLEEHLVGRPTNSLNEELHRELSFLVDLIDIGRHNLATISGQSGYFMRQSPFRAYLSFGEQESLLDKNGARDHLAIDWPQGNRVAAAATAAGATTASQLDNPGHENRERRSSASGSFSKAKLEKMDPLLRLVLRATRGDSSFEIPSFPLDQQPDPERVTHLDADLRYCSGRIKNQKNCGACYAFSWNAYAEWHYCRQVRGGADVEGDVDADAEPIDFSEQHIVDCGYKAKLNGCVDSRLSDVKDFSHVFGFHREADYPYTGHQAKVCEKRREFGPIQVNVRDFTLIEVDRREWEQILEEQPILVEAHMPRDYHSYSRGIHPGENCDSRIGHGMLLVGHGRQDGQPYWLLRNSAGRKWGENGYMRLSRDSPMKQCFAHGFVAKLKFKHLDEDKYDRFYGSIKFTPTPEPIKKPLKAGDENPIMKWLQ